MNARVTKAIQRANAEGRLGLILYTIPNFPDPTTYKQIYSHLCGLSFVTVIETTVPVTSQFSSHANETIAGCHRKAAHYNESWESILDGVDQRKPHIMVLYEETSKKAGFERFVAASSPKIDGVLLEWSEKNPEHFAKAAHNNGVEFIQCVGPWMSGAEIANELSVSLENPLVYLMSAPMTGAELFSPKKIAQTTQLLRKTRPNALIAAGFGINGTNEIHSLSEIADINAVIIGTAFLREVEKGVEAALTFLRSIEGALCRRS